MTVPSKVVWSCFLGTVWDKDFLLWVKSQQNEVNIFCDGVLVQSSPCLLTLTTVVGFSSPFFRRKGKKLNPLHPRILFQVCLLSAVWNTVRHCAPKLRRCVNVIYSTWIRHYLFKCQQWLDKQCNQGSAIFMPNKTLKSRDRNYNFWSGCVYSRRIRKSRILF